MSHFNHFINNFRASQQEVPVFTFLIFVILGLTSPVHAQSSVAGIRLGGFELLSLNDIAALDEGVLLQDDGDNLKIGSAEGILVLFPASPDVLWQPLQGPERDIEGNGELSLLAPVERRNTGWYATTDALVLLGLTPYEDQILLSSGDSVPISYSATAQSLGQDQQAESFLIEDNTILTALYTKDDTMSLLLTDAQGLGLIMPDVQQVVQSLLPSLGGNPIFFSITALVSSPWQNEVAFQQNGQRFIAKAPYDLIVLSGDARRVNSSLPVAGVILLPTSFDLRSPINVSWEGVTTEVQFRR